MERVKIGFQRYTPYVKEGFKKVGEIGKKAIVKVGELSKTGVKKVGSISDAIDSIMESGAGKAIYNLMDDDNKLVYDRVKLINKGIGSGAHTIDKVAIEGDIMGGIEYGATELGEYRKRDEDLTKRHKELREKEREEIRKKIERRRIRQERERNLRKNLPPNDFLERESRRLLAHNSNQDR